MSYLQFTVYKWLNSRKLSWENYVFMHKGLDWRGTCTNTSKPLLTGLSQLSPCVNFTVLTALYSHTAIYEKFALYKEMSFAYFFLHFKIVFLYQSAFIQLLNVLNFQMFSYLNICLTLMCSLHELDTNSCTLKTWNQGNCLFKEIKATKCLEWKVWFLLTSFVCHYTIFFIRVSYCLFVCHILQRIVLWFVFFSLRYCIGVCNKET